MQNEIIKKYVTGDKTRFEIAWDIRERFDEIIKTPFLHQLINAITDKLKENCNNGWKTYDQEAKFLKRGAGIYLKKDSWNIQKNGEDHPLFYLYLLPDARWFRSLYYGIEFSQEINSNDLSKIKKLLIGGNWHVKKSPYWSWLDTSEATGGKEFLANLIFQDKLDEIANSYATPLLNLKESVEAVIDDIVSSRKSS